MSNTGSSHLGTAITLNSAEEKGKGKLVNIEPGSVSSFHITARTTAELSVARPHGTQPVTWLPTIPDFSPVHYRILTALQERIYQQHVR